MWSFTFRAATLIAQNVENKVAVDLRVEVPVSFRLGVSVVMRPG
jgi:hypothetical protein